MSRKRQPSATSADPSEAFRELVYCKMHNTALAAELRELLEIVAGMKLAQSMTTLTALMGDLFHCARRAGTVLNRAMPSSGLPTQTPDAGVGRGNPSRAVESAGGPCPDLPPQHKKAGADASLE